jgi:hypothetical protein
MAEIAEQVRAAVYAVAPTVSATVAIDDVDIESVNRPDDSDVGQAHS